MHKNRTLDSDHRRKRILSVYGRDPENFDQLGECIIQVMSARTSNPVVGLAWDMTYDPKTSNTHSAPVTGETNWFCKSDKPLGYPGLEGRLWIRYQKEPQAFTSSSRLGDVLFYTGSGGGGSYGGPWSSVYSRYYRCRGRKIKPLQECNCFSWDARIYLADWPKLEQDIEHQHLVNCLNGVKSEFKHSFSWTDPETAKRDQEFLEESSRLLFAALE